MGSRFSRPRIILMISTALLVAVAGFLYEFSHADAAIVWTKVWSSHFNGPAGSSVNVARWSYRTGAGIFGNGEVESMTDSPRNVHLNGSGDLDITALRQGSTWTSGRIESRPLFTPPIRGELKVVASIRQPDPAGGLGYWPAFWLLGEGTWPGHGEIDILEDVNRLSDHSGAFHCGNLTQHNVDGTLGPCHEYTGLSSHLRPCGQCLTGFHVYTAVVDLRNPHDGRIDWYFDGHKFFTVLEVQVGAAVWHEAVNHGFRIILDLAIGGSYPDDNCKCSPPTSATSSGGTLSVRDVAVYKAP